jgi:hypothetical protein
VWCLSEAHLVFSAVWLADFLTPTRHRDRVLLVWPQTSLFIAVLDKSMRDPGSHTEGAATFKTAAVIIPADSPRCICGSRKEEDSVARNVLTNRQRCPREKSARRLQGVHWIGSDRKTIVEFRVCTTGNEEYMSRLLKQGRMEYEVPSHVCERYKPEEGSGQASAQVLSGTSMDA